MKGPLLIILFVAAFIGSCKTLEVELSLRSLLFGKTKSTIKEIIKILFINYDANLDFLLRLASCENLDFLPLMPKDLSLIEPLIESLQRKNYPHEIQSLFYDFEWMQGFEAGRRFLLQSNTNFTGKDWNPSIFTCEEKKTIFSRIQNSPPSKIEILPIALLTLAQHYNCSFKDLGIDRLWRMFPIPSFPSYLIHLNAQIFKTWFEEVELCIATDDLLFYRLACHYRYYRPLMDSQLASWIKESLQRKSSKGFRASVLCHYFQQGNFDELLPLFEIPDTVLQNDLPSRATLHFEHYFSAFEMGYEISPKILEKLFSTFEPPLVSPLVCRKLLEWLDYPTFTSILEGSPSWKDLHSKANRELWYFPTKFLPINAQLKLWRHRKVRVCDFPFSELPILYLNRPQTWQNYIGEEYNELEKIAIEENGFMLIDCCTPEKSIGKFIEGRIVEFLLGDKHFPKFNDEDEKPLVKRLCRMDCESQPEAKDAIDSLGAIKDVFIRWKVPDILFAFLHKI